MRLEDLRPELNDPEIRGVSLAFLDLVAWRSRMVAELREATGEVLTVTDCNVMLHVFVFGLVDDHGSRTADIVNNLAIPRRTARDSLASWQRLGVIVEEAGRYYPTRACAEVFNERFHDHFRLLARICATFSEYRKAIGRDTP
jgi:hypothetical protein